MKLKITATDRITLSLVGIMTSLLLLAGVAGIFPDRASDILDGRMRLCESLAISFSKLASTLDADQLRDCFHAVARRNPDMKSIGLRKSEGILLFEVGGHSQHWVEDAGEKSTETQIVVPVFSTGRQWGSVEVCFRPIHRSGLEGVLGRREFTLAAFMIVACCVAFNAFLRRVLKQLNPSKVVPRRVREALNSLAEGILVIDSREHVVLANHAFERAVGANEEQLIGKPASDLPFIAQEDGQAAPWRETFHCRQPVMGRLMGLDGRGSTFSVSASPILDDQGSSRGVLASFEDVTKLRDNQQELKQMVHQLHVSNSEIHRQNLELAKLANCDPLTGCRNRRSFFELFETLWSSARRYETPLSAVMVDIDHFKSINDTHGHAVGDEVLRDVAAALLEQMREADVLCRYGGEEFVVLMPHTDLEQGEVAAERLRLAIAQLRFPNLAVTASFGVSSICQSPADPEQLLDQADKCLYVAKRNGRNQVVRFDQVPAEDLSGEAPARETPADLAVETTIPYHAVSALLSALCYRDQETAAHSRRVADLCVKMAEGLLSLKDCYALEMAALLHDIGKIGVPDSILRKPGVLTDSEWKVMRTNVRIGGEIVKSSFASSALSDLVASCRVWFCKQPKMPIGARILAVADAYDSMVRNQVYRDKRTPAQALDELRAHAGTQFDPEIVERLSRLVAIESSLNDAPRESGVQSVTVAMHIGVQMERLVAALDRQSIEDIRALSESLHETAEGHGAYMIADKAAELDAALQDRDIDMIGIMQIASELLDLCRTTQAALLRANCNLATAL